MPRTRSRPKTEEKFQNAVLELVARAGCGALGINAIAQKAGADKVLIYRYFGDINGLLQRVAESRNWLPSPREIVAGLHPNPASATHLLSDIHQLIVRHLHADTTAGQLVRWRKADKNALTNYFSGEWHGFWRELPTLLANGLSYDAREAWKRACALVALAVEAELCGEGIDAQYLKHIAIGLELAPISESSADFDTAASDDGHLPTNLL